MHKPNKILWIVLFMLSILSCNAPKEGEEDSFEPTLESSRPWVYWYWMQSAYSREGITADLEAMKETGIGGAYLMAIKGPADPPLIDPPVLQLSPEWWDMVEFAMKEADRLGMELAMHASDGFAVAGGPWITRELSMQKVVWSDTLVRGGQKLDLQLPIPPNYKGYYEDIAVFALPVKENYRNSTQVQPQITWSSDDKTNLNFLSDRDGKGNVKMYEKGWVQYSFNEPFTCRNIKIITGGNNYQSHRLIIETSKDGVHFERVTRLIPPRQGWQDTDAAYTHAIEPVTSRYFRFVYDPEGSEPGAEDLDAAKWKPALKVNKIILSEEPKIDQYEGKSGVVWRISTESTTEMLPPENCLAKEDIINITAHTDAEGKLSWDAPEGKWKIMRFAHTSTGHTNATGGGGVGLEVDKFNPEAIRLQFDKWFGEAIRTAGPELAARVLRILHIDSWECGSQNWSPVFRKAFKERRGYDLVDYLPVVAGIPLEDAETSEKVLYDVRKTISELIADNFFGTMAGEAQKAGVAFSTENVAPTMVSDALRHFRYVDYPGGEFWLKSPTHDKPNDMLDAISGGHIYGKDIIQAEAYTELRMDWDEHPGNLKALGDRNYALGINRFFYHVFVHNPWPDRKPGMTLDGVGTYIQRNQTWWKPGKAWIDYAQRVQYELQKGKPVIDLAVFTGEELPSRAVLPDRLVPSLPGIFGEETVQKERVRLANEGQPLAKMPKEVTSSANITDLSHWVNALHGYKYDSFNPDVLLRKAKVEDGKVTFGAGIYYGALVFPGSRKMSPNAMMSIEVAQKILELVKAGATVFLGTKPERTPGFGTPEDKEKLEAVVSELWAGASGGDTEELNRRKIGKGTVIMLPYTLTDFSPIGIEPDITITGEDTPEKVPDIAYTHRRTTAEDIYFISNQKERKRRVNISFRVTGKVPELYDAVSGKTTTLREWKTENGRTTIPLQLDKNASVFVKFREKTRETSRNEGKNWKKYAKVQEIGEDWKIIFDPAFHGPKTPVVMPLSDWSTSGNDSIRYYSGTAVYEKTFTWNGETGDTWLNLGDVANIAEVSLNNTDCGTIWTYPHRVFIGEALQKGENKLVIKITNTWANRLIGDQKLPASERLTNTTAPFRLEDTPLLKAGLLGPVVIEE
ncbi:glycosyl hydrolase [Sinomicrobium sp. M5D2P9]